MSTTATTTTTTITATATTKNPPEIKVHTEIKETIEAVEEYLKKERNKEFMWTTLALKLAKVSARWRSYKDGINDNFYDNKVIEDCEVYHDSVFHIMKKVREELEKEAEDEAESQLKKKLLKNVQDWEKSMLDFETQTSEQTQQY